MYEDCLSKKESDVYGLKYIPSIEPTYSNSADYVELSSPKIVVGSSDGNGQYTRRNYIKTLREFRRIKKQCECIFEIGVATNFEKSSTELWLTNKNDDTHYFGIDISMDGKWHHEQYKPNTHLLQLNSDTDRNLIYENMLKYGCDQIDVLFIDGDHSIDLIVNDWKYAELVRPGGLILLHDIAIHPGPHLILDAIDETMFDKKTFFCDDGNDWGLAVIWKK